MTKQLDARTTVAEVRPEELAKALHYASEADVLASFQADWTKISHNRKVVFLKQARAVLASLRCLINGKGGRP